MESRRNSSGTPSHDLIRCSSATKVKSLLSKYGETPENFPGIILFMSMFNDISCGTRDNEEECLAGARLVSFKNFWQTLDSYLCTQENLVKDNGHSLVLVPKRIGIL